MGDEMLGSTFGLEDLIAWSQNLPAWQRDALRRVLNKGTLSEDDVAELCALAKSAHQATQGDGPEPVPATEENSGAVPTALPAVTLRGISEISHVNALGPGPIIFEKTGVTVLYGENGSGKSGIARILKHVGHTTGDAGPVHPNVFEEAPDQPASAKIDYVVGDDARTHDWKLGCDPVPALKAIQVLDSGSARVRVSTPNSVSYTPWILEVFRLLADGVFRVAEALRAERVALGRPSKSVADLPLTPGTVAHEYREKLGPSSDTQVLSKLATLSEDELKRIDGLERTLGSGKGNRLTALRALQREFAAFLELAQAIESSLGEVAFTSLQETLEEATRDARAANEAKAVLEEATELDGIGTTTWKAMWDAAREYSTNEAYAGLQFPQTSDDAVCVLCQQPLSEGARTRLQAFEAFVQDAVQKKADRSGRAARSALEKARGVDLPSASRSQVLALGLEEVPAGKAVREYLVAAKCRRRAARKVPPVPGQAPPLPARPDLSDILAGIATEISDIEAGANEKRRSALHAELQELKDRKLLRDATDEIRNEIQRQHHEQVLEAAISSANTYQITLKQGQVEESLLTGALKRAFGSRLLGLGFSEAPVSIELGGGRRGEHPYAVAIDAEIEVAPAEVLSEGERSAVALAGLLAEIGTSGNDSALVLDDPVTSLDHNYRDRVAAVLAQEGLARQIIVFTHDIAFLARLESYARDRGTPLAVMTVLRGSSKGNHGQVDSDAPWERRGVKARLRTLETQLAEARRLEADQNAYDREAISIYERLRETWERAVEETLLNGAVTRFEEAVHTQRLQGVDADNFETDLGDVMTEMSSCSAYLHDTPPTLRKRPPGPQVIGADIDKLRQWKKRIDKRRQ